MLNEVLSFLKERLNNFLIADSNSAEAQVVYLNGNQGDSISFKVGAVTLLMINLENEPKLRSPNSYRRQVFENGSTKIKDVNPEIRLNLYILFVANYSQYTDSLKTLSQVIQFFQSNRIFTSADLADLSQDIEKLLVELHTMSFSEQNEIWNALRLPYQPSLAYKVQMIVFQEADDQAGDLTPITEIGIKTGRKKAGSPEFVQPEEVVDPS